jgi:hypothetical protein
VQAFKTAVEKRLKELEEKVQSQSAGKSVATDDSLRAEAAQVRKTLEALGSAQLDNCGFERAFAPGFPGKGHHRLTVKVLTKDRGAFFASAPPADFNVGE